MICWRLFKIITKVMMWYVQLKDFENKKEKGGFDVYESGSGGVGSRLNPVSNGSAEFIVSGASQIVRSP